MPQAFCDFHAASQCAERASDVPSEIVSDLIDEAFKRVSIRKAAADQASPHSPSFGLLATRHSRPSD